MKQSWIMDGDKKQKWTAPTSTRTEEIEQLHAKASEVLDTQFPWYKTRRVRDDQPKPKKKRKCGKT